MTQPSATAPSLPFVGRAAELSHWQQVLTNPCGQAVLVQGAAGMGKTKLLKRMADLARAHSDFRCGCLRYEVTPTDAPESTMGLMLDHAWEAAGINPKSLDATPQRLEQWRSFLNVFNIGDLVMSLRRNPAQSTRDQFIAALHKITGRLESHERLLIFVDPEKLMPPGSADTWRLVVRDLPDKLKLVFAQRPNDALINSTDFLRLTNLVRIPDASLAELTPEDINELVDLYPGQIKAAPSDIRSALARYDGYPYAVGAAYDLLASGLPIERLPPDPDGLIAEQWTRAHDLGGNNAWKLLTTYAVLEVAVPDEVALAVAELSPDDLRVFLGKPFLASLLRSEPTGRRLYHVMMRDYRLDSMETAEVLAYHRRAVEVYRQRLKADVKPDALAALRLPEHVLALEGEIAFVDCLISECNYELDILSMLDESEAFHRRSLALPGLPYDRRAILLGNYAVIEGIRGKLNAAEALHREALKIDRELGRLEGQASNLDNIGIIERRRDNLDAAEKLHREALEINHRLGRLAGLAGNLSNLGLIEKRRGNFDVAEKLHHESLAIARNMGLDKVVANNLSNLGIIEGERGNIDVAEKLHHESLAINLRLGRLTGQATALGNLGNIAKRRGHLERARRLWIESRDLYVRVGIPHMVKQLQDWIDGLPETSE